MGTLVQMVMVIVADTFGPVPLLLISVSSDR